MWAWRHPLPGQTPQLPHWVWAWRPARHAGIPPPPPQCTEFLTYATENITLPQMRAVKMIPAIKCTLGKLRMMEQKQQKKDDAKLRTFKTRQKNGTPCSTNFRMESNNKP